MTARATPAPWGHNEVAHRDLGWCAACPGVDAVAECMAWRLLAMGEEPWTLAYATLVKDQPRATPRPLTTCTLPCAGERPALTPQEEAVTDPTPTPQSSVDQAIEAERWLRVYGSLSENYSDAERRNVLDLAAAHAALSQAAATRELTELLSGLVTVQGSLDVNVRQS